MPPVYDNPIGGPVGGQPGGGSSGGSGSSSSASWEGNYGGSLCVTEYDLFQFKDEPAAYYVNFKNMGFHWDDLSTVPIEITYFLPYICIQVPNHYGNKYTTANLMVKAWRSAVEGTIAQLNWDPDSRNEIKVKQLFKNRLYEALNSYMPGSTVNTGQSALTGKCGAVPAIPGHWDC